MSNSTGSSFLKGMLGCFGVGAAVLLVGGGCTAAMMGAMSASESSSSSSESESSSEASVDEVKNEEAAHGLNDTVEHNDLAFTVTGYEDGLTSASGSLGNFTPDGQYVAVYITAENVGSAGVYFESHGVQLYDTEDREFSHDSDATIAMDDGPFLGELNPAQSGDFTVVFDIPEDAEAQHVTVSGDMFEGGVAVSLN